MGDTSTAMRDPVFFRWHKFIDSLFQEFIETRLPPYSTKEVMKHQQLIFKSFFKN